MLLVARVKLGEEHHLFSELGLLETLFDEEIVFLMHSSVESLTGSGEDFETSSQPIE